MHGVAKDSGLVKLCSRIKEYGTPRGGDARKKGRIVSNLALRHSSCRQIHNDSLVSHSSALVAIDHEFSPHLVIAGRKLSTSIPACLAPIGLSPGNGLALIAYWDGLLVAKDAPFLNPASGPAHYS
jgi:hypothetical protein